MSERFKSTPEGAAPRSEAEESWDKTADAQADDRSRSSSSSRQVVDDKEKKLEHVTTVAGASEEQSPLADLTEEEWAQLEPAELNERLLRLATRRLLQRADPQVEAARPDPQWLEQLQRSMEAPDSQLTLRDFLSAVFDHFADRPCLATRADERSPYAALSYRDVWTRVKRIAAGMQASGILRQAKAKEPAAAAASSSEPQSEFEPGPVTVGLYGFPSSDWVCVYLACLWLGVCAVPLQTNMSREALTHVLRHGQLRVVVARASMLSQLAPAIEQAPSVQCVVTIDTVTPPTPSSPPSPQHRRRSLSDSAAVAEALAHVRTLSLQELTEIGKESSEQKEEAASSTAVAPPSPSLILFTSGSTGKPKGAVFPEPLWRRMMALRRRPPCWEVLPIIMTLYNLSHISGLWTLHEALSAGGTVHFLLRHDMSTFFNDCREMRPTTFFLVPRLMELVYEHFLAQCMHIASEKRMAEPDEAIRQRIMQSMRHSYFGDRLCLVQTGSAVTQPHMLHWFRRCFLVPVYDIYGQTESLGIARDGRILRPNVEAYKLVSVPELGYRTSDQPHPRGELCVRTRDMIPEYFRDADATASLRDADGFLHTGDIVVEIGPDRIAYLDRSKNTLKLSQGEFVSLAQLENVFTSASHIVAQMFMYGRSDQSYLLAAVVPHMDQVRAKLGDKADSPANVKALLQGELQRVANAAGLAGWEVPRDLIVEPEHWSKANGLLTDSDKYARPLLQARYGSTFAVMYDEIDRRTKQSQLQFESTKAERSPRDHLLSAVTGVLGCDVEPESGLQLSFVRMGGDSLSASRLAGLLEERCGVTPPVAMLLDPNATLAELAEWLEEAMSHRQQHEHWRPAFKEVHRHAPKVARAADLNLERFFSADAIQQAARLPIASGPKHVLLTGANGFLGRFLLLELLQRGLRVTAIVRAASDEEAAKRLRASYGDLAGLLDSLSAHQGSLRVLAGDLMRGSLGLSPDEFASLCSSVDTVLHNGALVNHYLSYEQLWEPNVLGTVELMRFAMLGQRKPIVFMSSVAVAWRGKGTGQGAVLEKQRGAELWPERALTNEYAEGYASSKWACEVLLEQLSQRCGVPTTIIRSSMVLAHPDLKGQVNKSDFVTRLFISLVRTQCRPHSFYEETEGGSSSGSESHPRAHFDGVPVNVSSAGIVAALLPKSAREEGACTTLHAVNAHHSDGVSLDSFADWVASAGYRLETLRPYSHWFAELSRRLSELPREVRDTSAYPIRHQWARPIASDAEPQLDNSAFSSVLAAHTPFTAGVPVLDERFIHTYLSHMRSIGLIPEPTEKQ